MGATLHTLENKQRALRIAGWVLMVICPFLVLAAISLGIGQNAFGGVPVWTDELDYWRSIESWLHVGNDVGYSGLYELTPTLGTLSVHGFSPLLLYGWYASIFGWSYASITMANALWVAAGALTFCLLNKPKASTALIITLTLMLYGPVLLYAPTSMTEMANYGLLLFYLAFMVRLAHVRKAAMLPQAEHPSMRVGLMPLVLGMLTVTLCCAYRITYMGLFIPLMLVAFDFRWSGKLLLGLLVSLAISVGVYLLTTLYTSPYPNGFLYNFLRTGSLPMSVRMFLSHAKANVIDYFLRPTNNAMEMLQRLLYCTLTATTLFATFVHLQRDAAGKLKLQTGIDWFSALAFVTLVLPFMIVVCLYETNDWSDYRTLAPFLWLVVVGYVLHGRKGLPTLYLAGCTAIVVVLLTGGTVGAYGDDNRFTMTPFSPGMQELCTAIEYDADASDPYTNTVRTDLFNLETVASLHPGMGLQTGWFTQETVIKSRWILTDHLKVPVEGYELVLKNKNGSVYRLKDSYEQP